MESVGHVSVGLAAQDIADDGLTCVEDFGESWLRFDWITPSNLADVVIREVGGVMSRPLDIGSDIVAAPFADHVVIVIKNSSDKKVIGTTTRRVIATMQHPQTSGDWAVCEFVGNTMCENSFPTQTPIGISLAEYGAFPWPTSFEVGFINSIPEVFKAIHNDSVTQKHRKEQ